MLKRSQNGKRSPVQKEDSITESKKSTPDIDSVVEEDTDVFLSFGLGMS
jgi:hypothetical protein